MFLFCLTINVTLIANAVLISEETDKSLFFKSNEINYNQKIQTEGKDCRYFTRLPLASLSLEKQCLFVNEQTRLPLCQWKYSYSSLKPSGDWTGSIIFLGNRQTTKYGFSLFVREWNVSHLLNMLLSTWRKSADEHARQSAVKSKIYRLICSSRTKTHSICD